jgi:hypothetical protein
MSTEAGALAVAARTSGGGLRVITQRVLNYTPWNMREGDSHIGFLSL